MYIYIYIYMYAHTHICQSMTCMIRTTFYEPAPTSESAHTQIYKSMD